MPAADTGKTRTVADIMSTPGRRPRRPTTRWPRRPPRCASSASARSSSSTTSRPVGILTERDLVRIAAAGRRHRRPRRSREWMTAEPDSVGPDVDATAAFASLSEHGYRHIPVVDDDEVVGIVSMRDLMRIAQIQPAENLAHEIPRGLEGVVVAETDDRRRPRPRRLLPLPPVQRGRPRGDALARRRLAPDVRGRAAARSRERDAFARATSRRCARSRRRSTAALPEIARLGDRRAAARHAAHHGLAARRDTSASSRRSTSTPRSCASRRCGCARSCPTLLTAIYRLQHGLEPIDPDPELAYAANYLYMMQRRRCPTPEHAARGREVPHLDDRPRLQRVDVHRPRDHLDRRRPRGRGRRRDRRALRPAARRRAEPRARHARRDRHPRQRRAVAARRGRARRPAHGLRPPRLQDRRPALGHAARASPSGSAATRWSSPSRSRRRRSRCSPSSSRAGKLYTNVEFYAGIVMDRCGLPREMFTPTFASSRVIGWCAHILEQAADNRLIRPSARYVGPPPPQPVPDAGVADGEAPSHGSRRSGVAGSAAPRAGGCGGARRRRSSRTSTEPNRSTGTLRRSKVIGTLRFSLTISCVSPSWISPAISASSPTVLVDDDDVHLVRPLGLEPVELEHDREVARRAAPGAARGSSG